MTKFGPVKDGLPEGLSLGEALDALAFNDQGLIPAIAQDAADGTVLMLAWMSRASIERSLAEGRAVYWSRSRQSFWRKGDSSGHVQKLIEIRVDCDADCLLLIVEQTGAACHTGERSCFFTALRPGAEGGAATVRVPTGAD